MMQLVHVARARCTDHSNPLGEFHHLIFIDSEQETSNEDRSHDGDMYKISLCFGHLDKNTINRCFDEAEKKKAAGNKRDMKS